MKPSRPYHAFTSDHREPAGLRALDFIVGRIDAWREERLPALVRILVVRSGNGHIALPLASLGYSVTALEADDVTCARLQETAKELPFALRCVHGTLAEVSHETFDVVVDLSLPADASVMEELTQIRDRCAPHGCILLSASRRFMPLLKRAGVKPQRMVRDSVFLKRAFPFFAQLGVKKGDAAFHRLDAMDAWLSNHVSVGTRTFCIQAAPFDPSTPLVMHFIPTFASGGAERVVYDLTEQLPLQGFSAKAIAVMGGGALETLFAEKKLPYEISPKRGPFGSFAFFTAREAILREQPDIVHTHLFGADLWGRLAAFASRVPVVVSTEHRLLNAESWVKRMLSRVLAQRSNAIVAISEDVRRDLETRVGVPKERLHVIHNGIDISRVIPRGTRPFSDKPKLISVGRLAPGKGHAILLKALALVKQPWTLDLVGEGPLEAELRELAERLAIAPRIRWLGYRTDVPQLVSDADLFCFPSLSEGLGLAFIEAAATGIPIIASDLPAFREVLPKEAMTCVPPGDVPELAHAIRTVLEDPYAAIQQAVQCAEHVQKTFGRDVMVRSYAELYRSALKTQRV